MIRFWMRGVMFEIETVGEVVDLVRLLEAPSHSATKTPPAKKAPVKAPAPPIQNAPVRDRGGRPPAPGRDVRESQVVAMMRRHRDGVSADDLARESKLSRERLKTILARLRSSGLVRSEGRSRGARWHAVVSTDGQADSDQEFERVWDGSQKDVSLTGDGFTGSSLSGAHRLASA